MYNIFILFRINLVCVNNTLTYTYTHTSCIHVYTHYVFVCVHTYMHAYT